MKNFSQFMSLNEQSDENTKKEMVLRNLLRCALPNIKSDRYIKSVSVKGQKENAEMTITLITGETFKINAGDIKL